MDDFGIILTDYRKDLTDAGKILLAANITFAGNLFDYMLSHPLTQPIIDAVLGPPDMDLFEPITTRGNLKVFNAQITSP